MKIALVTYALNIGGVESVLLSLAEYFKRKNYVVEFIETSAKGEWSDEFYSKGYKVNTILIKPFESRINHSKRISKFLNNFDVIYLNDSPFAQSSIGLLHNNIKIFPILHNNIESMIFNAVSSTSNWNNIICVSPSLKKELNNRFPNMHKRFKTIANGVNVENKNFKEKFNFQNISIIKILYVGRIEHKQKGVLHIPDIINELKKKNFKINMTIVGGGPSEDKLLNKIQILNLQNEINFIGKKNHNEVIEIMKENHIFLMPSYYEGHPIVLMEAMSYGLIPIVTNLPGHTDIVVKNKKNGFLCDINNINTFTTIIIKILSKKYNLKILSNNAWETINNEFNLKKLGDNYMDLIIKSKNMQKSNTIDITVLGDFPKIPYILVRPLRKIFKILRIYRIKK